MLIVSERIYCLPLSLSLYLSLSFCPSLSPCEHRDSCADIEREINTKGKKLRGIARSRESLIAHSLVFSECIRAPRRGWGKRVRLKDLSALCTACNICSTRQIGLFCVFLCFVDSPFTQLLMIGILLLFDKYKYQVCDFRDLRKMCWTIWIKINKKCINDCIYCRTYHHNILFYYFYLFLRI